MSSRPGDLPPLLGALLTQQLAPGLSCQTRRARSWSSNSSDQESAETRQKRVDASSTPQTTTTLRDAHSVCLPFFAGKFEEFCFLSKRPWQVSGNDKTVFKFASHCPLPLNTFQMDLGHAFMFGGYQLMNPRRCRLSHSFHTIFLLDVDAFGRFLRHF